jgi:hypothetical protein
VYRGITKQDTLAIALKNHEGSFVTRLTVLVYWRQARPQGALLSCPHSMHYLRIASNSPDYPTSSRGRVRMWLHTGSIFNGAWLITMSSYSAVISTSRVVLSGFSLERRHLCCENISVPPPRHKCSSEAMSVVCYLVKDISRFFSTRWPDKTKDDLSLYFCQTQRSSLLWRDCIP